VGGGVVSITPSGMIDSTGCQVAKIAGLMKECYILFYWVTYGNVWFFQVSPNCSFKVKIVVSVLTKTRQFCNFVIYHNYSQLLITFIKVLNRYYIFMKCKYNYYCQTNWSYCMILTYINLSMSMMFQPISYRACSCTGVVCWFRFWRDNEHYIQ